MSDADRRAEMARKTIVLEIPGMDAVQVRRDLRVSETLVLDVYTPPGAARSPAVLFVYGFAHPLFAQGLKEMGAYSSWGRLLAASGIAAVTYAYREPVADLEALLAHLRAHGDDLGIDVSRLAVWAASGNVPTAIHALITQPPGTFRGAALCYGFTLDLDGGTEVAAAAAGFGCATPAAGRTASDLPSDLPLLVVRAGQDATPGLNASLDRFAAAALAANLPMTLVNLPDAPHAFDLLDDRDSSRAAIRGIVAFLQAQLA